MRYFLTFVAIFSLIVISYVFAGDRLTYNNCMIQAKSDYISTKGAAHVAAQCKAFILDKIMVK
jgi:hypothetical protein